MCQRAPPERPNLTDDVAHTRRICSSVMARVRSAGRIRRRESSSDTGNRVFCPRRVPAFRSAGWWCGERKARGVDVECRDPSGGSAGLSRVIPVRVFDQDAVHPVNVRSSGKRVRQRRAREDIPSTAPRTPPPSTRFVSRCVFTSRSWPRPQKRPGAASSSGS